MSKCEVEGFKVESRRWHIRLSRRSAVGGDDRTITIEKQDSIFFYVRSHYDPVTTYYDPVDNQNTTHFLVINRKRLKVYDVEVVLER